MKNPSKDEKGVSILDMEHRIQKGGGYDSRHSKCGVDHTDLSYPYEREIDIGFRMVRNSNKKSQ